MDIARRRLLAALAVAPAGLALDMFAPAPLLAESKPGASPRAPACAGPIQSGGPSGGGFLALYAGNRRESLPNLVTESFLLHAVGLSARKAQMDLEKGTIVPLFGDWIAAVNKGLGDGADPIASGLAQVVAALAGRPAAAGNEAVAAELKLVAEGQGIDTSPLLKVAVDYSQMKPRGHYADDPALSAYFQASRYASTMPLLLQPSEATGVDAAKADGFMAAAMALSAAMTADPARPLTEKLFDLLDRSFGASEDYSARDLAGVTVAAAELRGRMLAEAPARGKLPAVIDVALDIAKLGTLTSAQAAVSWRMLPGRRLADVAAMQALIYPKSGEIMGKAQPFGLGTIDDKPVKAYVGLDDLFWIYGTDAGNWKLEGKFKGMDEAGAAARKALALPSAPSDALGRFFVETLKGAPGGRRINALAGYYVHYRHGLALYAKQSMASAPKSLSLGNDRSGAVLEADLTFLAALRGLVADHGRRLPAPLWQQWDSLLGDLETVAWRDRFGCHGADEDELLNNLDLQIAELVDPAHDAPIVTDIHTVPSEGKVVEVGIGQPMLATAGKARGGDFSVYQFKQPMADRLTDAAFVEMVGKDDGGARRWMPGDAGRK